MNCLQSEKWIQEALDGALTARERDALDAHLADCAACRAAWAEYRSLARTATVWTRSPIHAADPGEAFTAQVMAQIAARPSTPAVVPLATGPRLVWAGVVVLVLIACGLLFPIPAVPTPTPNLLPHLEAALSLPAWLWACVSGLPAAAVQLWSDLMREVSVSGVMIGLLTGALLLNGLLYARTVRRTRRSLAP